MKASKLISALFILSIFTFTGCGGSDEDSSGLGQTGQPSVGVIMGEKGSKFEITIGGKKETCSSDNLFGWEKGMLLNSSYFRQVRISCDEFRFRLQVSLPHDVSFLEIAEGSHQLSPNRILLQDTSYLDDVYFEFYEISIPTEAIHGNATGTIKLRRDVPALSTTYSLVGEVDASFYNNGGSTVTVKGSFWKKDTDW